MLRFPSVVFTDRFKDVKSTSSEWDTDAMMANRSRFDNNLSTRLWEKLVYMDGKITGFRLQSTTDQFRLMFTYDR